MRILVTGGAGMIGSHAAERFARAGWKVTVLDNLMRSKLMGSDKQSVEYNWNYLAKFDNIRRVRGDVRNDRDVREAVGKGVDAVIHAAGQPGVGLSLREPYEDFTINALGTLKLLEWVRRVSPKAAFVYCSTNKVYGENVEKLSLKEGKSRYSFAAGKAVSESMSVDLAGHTPYGASKYAGDLYVQEYAHAYGLKTGVFRMSCIYGTRQFGFEDQGWVAWFVIAAIHGRPLTLYGDGKQVRDVLFVDDLVSAYERFIRGRIRHGVWNMGGGPKNTTSLLELLDLLEDRLGRRPKVGRAPWRVSDQKVYVSDISKAKRELGWSPKVGFEEGLDRLINWVRANPGLF
ncbi:MAG: NAD-dependent epimerase/dehydratase family protein [Elusimicrobia bacterium]|nr:NAD-dependent epimerase/dehydratase family protein [Elusimicrobiota bacterium]